MREKRRNRAAQKQNTPATIKEGFDLPFFVFVILLLSVGLVMLFSASHANAFDRFGDSYYFIKQQAKWAILGLVGMFVATYVCTPAFLKKMALPALGISIVLLALVPIIGVTKNGAKRWLGVGDLTFQPSEIAKVAVILAFAYLMSNNQKKMNTFRGGILPYGIILVVVCGLIAVEKHISATVLTFAVGIIMMVAGGSNLVWLCSFGAAGVAGVVGIILNSSYAMQRVKVWLDPFIDPRGDGFQNIQSLYAIGSGGFFGLGLGKSRQKYMYIPEPQNDFIFAIACEELGFLGALIIISLFALLIWRGFVIAFRAPDRFSALVVVGIISKVAIQTVLNIAVVTNLVPNTGIPLPFFSYGGTALLIQLCEMGVVLAISRYSRLRRS
ncbi:putative lipid II flippase FtsW [Feifania hominis]|uniref:putative lipid II flippase FtsW n=1 Tax=Feifania hominis TaxID=2763660 RepID=UPI00201680C9|nr:putative lipid II flippase FtsW [Feifania hominis]